jgi:hypothetical protein
MVHRVTETDRIDKLKDGEYKYEVNEMLEPLWLPRIKLPKYRPIRKL